MKIRYILYIIGMFLLGCSRNLKKENFETDKISFKSSFYMGNSIVSNKKLIHVIDKKCIYSEPYVKQSEEWNRECPVSKISGYYYDKIKKLEQAEGRFGKFDLVIKRFEQKEKYFDGFTNTETEINTLKLCLYTFKNQEKIDSMDIYISKNGIWGEVDQLYYLNGDKIWILELDADVETGISANSWKAYDISENTGKFELRDSFINDK